MSDWVESCWNELASPSTWLPLADFLLGILLVLFLYWRHIPCCGLSNFYSLLWGDSCWLKIIPFFSVPVYFKEWVLYTNDGVFRNVRSCFYGWTSSSYFDWILGCYWSVRSISWSLSFCASLSLSSLCSHWSSFRSYHLPNHSHQSRSCSAPTWLVSASFTHSQPNPHLQASSYPCCLSSSSSWFKTWGWEA